MTRGWAPTRPLQKVVALMLTIPQPNGVAVRIPGGPLQGGSTRTA
jgi:hypothetical protein